MVDSSTSPVAHLGDDVLRTQLLQLRDHLQTVALLGGIVPEAAAAQLEALEAELQRRGVAEVRVRGDDGFGDDGVGDDVFGLDEGRGHEK